LHTLEASPMVPTTLSACSMATARPVGQQRLTRPSGLQESNRERSVRSMATARPVGLQQSTRPSGSHTTREQCEHVGSVGSAGIGGEGATTRMHVEQEGASAWDCAATCRTTATPSLNALQRAEQDLAAAEVMEVDDGAGVFDLPARRSNAQRRVAEARREEYARMAPGATRRAVAAASTGHPPPAPAAQSSVSHSPHADAPTASQLLIEPAEMADATSLSLETAAAEARNAGNAEAMLQAEVRLATARSAVTWASETSMRADDSWQLAEAFELSETEATGRALADDRELARGVQASLDEGTFQSGSLDRCAARMHARPATPPTRANSYRVSAHAGGGYVIGVAPIRLCPRTPGLTPIDSKPTLALPARVPTYRLSPGAVHTPAGLAHGSGAESLGSRGNAPRKGGHCQRGVAWRSGPHKVPPVPGALRQPEI
jgi:hypothetical protein